MHRLNDLVRRSDPSAASDEADLALLDHLALQPEVSIPKICHLSERLVELCLVTDFQAI